MQKSTRIVICAALGATALAALPSLAQRAPTSGPVARYDMRAGTLSGFGAMGGGMGMMFGGGGNKVQHELYLRLGSSRGPDKGGPKADHFMPPSAKLGKSVALVTPTLEKQPMDEFPGERPRGRLLIFWGCGEHAPKGQPVVIDFAKIAAGQMPAGIWSSTVIRDWGPSQTNSKTFGRWPAEDGKYAKADTRCRGRTGWRATIRRKCPLPWPRTSWPRCAPEMPNRRAARRCCRGGGGRRDRLSRHAVRRPDEPGRQDGRHGDVDQQRGPPVRRRAG